MYRCTECGSEYEVKPDFCDCGNDEFIDVSDVAEAVKPDQSVKAELPKQEDKPKPQPAKAVYTKHKLPKRTFSEQYPALSDFLKSLDPISTIIFFVCILLTIIVVLYKPEFPEQETVVKETVQTVKNIPNIDKFWNSELPKVEKKQEETPKEEKPVAEEVQKIIQTITVPAKKVQTVKKTTVQKTVQPAKQTNQKKTAQQTKTSTVQTSKPVTQTAQKIQTSQKVQSSQPVQQTQKPQQTQQVVQAQKPQQVQPVQTVQTPSAEDIAKKTAQAKQELSNYKTGLRNTIGRKIDFTKVVGDGTCVVSFKVNSSGKLVSRAFTKQSSNITLNDAVYAAVMSTPTYNPPPTSYSNETMSITITFYNGNYEISIK